MLTGLSLWLQVLSGPASKFLSMTSTTSVVMNSPLDRAFTAVVALYSIPHLPLEEQPSLFERIARWLQLGGYLMDTLGKIAWTGTENDWLEPGVTMYWSHTNEDTYIKWLIEDGLRVVWTRFIPEGDGGHPLILAPKPYQA